MQYRLNETEEKTLEKWLNTKAIKGALKKGARLSLTFSETGIGRSVIAKLDNGILPTQYIIYPPPQKDITDYKSW